MKSESIVLYQMSHQSQAKKINLNEDGLERKKSKTIKSIKRIE